MSTNTTESPITVTVDYDPRGVSVGVWQGSHCIYSGAHPLPAAPGASTAGNQQPARDWELTCHECDGSGHVYVKHQVAERKTDTQEFKEECECCEGRGFVFAFQDIPGIEEYVKTCRPASSAPGVSTVEDAGAQKEAVMDAIADALGDAYDCTRVWHAWSYGTMGPDDFALVAADPSRVAEIATAAIAAMRPAPAAGDAIRDLIAKHAELLDKSDHTYFELARTRQTGWMAWLCSHPAETHPDRKVLARGQGETPDEACREALDDFEMRAAIAAQRKGDA
ncbi:hypothetical protein ACOTJL_19410 [Achromobacter xylosoxidans]